MMMTIIFINIIIIKIDLTVNEKEYTVIVKDDDDDGTQKILK